jgi:hypothetical protein
MYESNPSCLPAPNFLNFFHHKPSKYKPKLKQMMGFLNSTYIPNTLMLITITNI